MSTATDALTSLSHGAGCGCKLPAAALLPIVRDLGGVADERLLVGSATADDAAVFRLSDELALVQTVDFFTPIVDDPYDFGRIAAANALSDVYAMGATPLVALNIVAFPLERLGVEVLGEILRGGRDVRRAQRRHGGRRAFDRRPRAQVRAGGDRGRASRRGVHQRRRRTGDVLVLTKPLGVGAITTARQRGLTDDEQLLDRAVGVMAELNASAAIAARHAGAHAVTDVTGFGLLGHLHNVCRASGVAAAIEAALVPAIDGALELLDDDAGERAVSGGSRRNREYAATFTTFAGGVPAPRVRLLCDATTSGGLLVAVAEDHAARVPGPVLGRVVAGDPGTILVR